MTWVPAIAELPALRHNMKQTDDESQYCFQRTAGSFTQQEIGQVPLAV